MICSRLFIVALGTVTAFTSSIRPLIAQDAVAPRRPNIVILLADDLGYADLGFHGGQEIPTPRIDSLAKNGVRCTNGYVSGPYCSPTRAGLLTGRYQQRFGNEFNPDGNGNTGLAVSETTLADRLSDAGYATALIGKWHLGSAPQFHPQQRGFQDFYGFLEGQHTYWDRGRASFLRGTKAVVEPDYLTDALGREAVNFIGAHRDQPFLLYLAFNAVHTPLEATDDRLEKVAGIKDERRRAYAAMLSAMDDAIGGVLDKLRAEKLEENTLIYFLSDNGGPTMPGTTVNGSSNAPLRGSKRTTLEGGIRVPFVVQWTGQLPAGAVYEPPVIQLDLHTTALAAAGIAVETDWHLDGVNLLPFLKGEQQGGPHQALFWRLGKQRAVREGDWKLVQYDLTVDGQPKQGVSANRLYNLATDIGEANDLAAEHPERVQQLSAMWDAWAAELPAP